MKDDEMSIHPFTWTRRNCFLPGGKSLDNDSISILNCCLESRDSGDGDSGDEMTFKLGYEDIIIIK